MMNRLGLSRFADDDQDEGHSGLRLKVPKCPGSDTVMDRVPGDLTVSITSTVANE
jgi:hypothetical protein